MPVVVMPVIVVPVIVIAVIVMAVIVMAVIVMAVGIRQLAMAGGSSSGVDCEPVDFVQAQLMLLGGPPTIFILGGKA